MFINNQKKHGDKKPSSCEEVLGTNTDVNKLALVWEKYADLLQLVAAVKLYEWTSFRTFTTEQLDAYKAGLAELPVFLEACSREHLRRKMEEEKKSELQTKSKK